MIFLWIFYDFFMDFLWIFYGFFMDLTKEVIMDQMIRTVKLAPPSAVKLGPSPVEEAANCTSPSRSYFPVFILSNHGGSR